MRTLALLLLLVTAFPLFAGGGPEAVALIVNADNQDSKEVANAYVRLRNIPERNVIYLSNVPTENTISLTDFRQRILLPIFAQIKQRGLDQQIDYITYSCGFPTRVSFDRQYVKKMQFVYNPYASITGMTYLFQITLNHEFNFLHPHTNMYFRQVSYATNVNVKIQKAPADKMKPVSIFFQEKNKRDHKRRKDKVKKTEDDKAWEKDGWEKALKTLLSISEEFPNDPSLWYNIGCAQAMNGNSDEAINALKKSSALGYTNWSHARGDSDLASLKNLDSFKQWIEELKNIPLNVQDAIGFSARTGYNKQGQSGQELHYVICTMHGYTGERGNTVEEIINYLTLSAGADGSKPKGTIYYPINGDVRSRTREWGVRSAVKQLQDLGVNAVSHRGTVPAKKSDVMGAHVGIATFDLNKTETKLLPGAICEHLTSWGAEFERNGQTKISAWLRAGAAGSSGTISEPYALQFKFPNPFIHVHYAKGCSLGEAFYQSIESPYELLILGDALCQPWANKQSISVKGLPENKHITKAVEITLGNTDNVLGFIGLINGRAFAKAEANGSIQINPEQLVPGHYELRIVTIDKSRMQTRNDIIIPVQIGEEKTITSCTAKAQPDQILINFTTNKDERFAAMTIMHNNRIVARHANPNGEIIIQRNEIGKGPVTLRPVLLDEHQKPFALGKPISIK